MNLILHGLENSEIKRRDAIAGPPDDWDNDKFEIILANPPFAGSMNKERIREILPVPSTKTEILFLGLMIESLADEGTCGVIVPEGLLFGSSGAHLQIREKLLRDCDVKAVVSFPGGSFKPYSGVKTSALIFTKGKPTKKIWFYEVTADGFSLDDNRRPTPDKNDIPDLIAKWENQKVSDKSWISTIEQIRAADFNLTANRYKPVSTEIVKHDAPAEILGDILKLENEIARRGNSLLAQIGKEK